MQFAGFQFKIAIVVYDAIEEVQRIDGRNFDTIYCDVVGELLNFGRVAAAGGQQIEVDGSVAAVGDVDKSLNKLGNVLPDAADDIWRILPGNYEKTHCKLYDRILGGLVGSGSCTDPKELKGTRRILPDGCFLRDQV